MFVRTKTTGDYQPPKCILKDRRVCVLKLCGVRSHLATVTSLQKLLKYSTQKDWIKVK